jgi:hypothetical protein
VARAPGASVRDYLARFNFNSAVALGVIAFGVAIWLLVPYQVPDPPRLFGMGSGGLSAKLFPRIVALLLIVTGVYYFVASFRLREENTLAYLTLGAYGNLAVILALMIAYVVMLRPVGFVTSSLVVAAAISLYYGSRSIIGIFIVSVVAPLAIYNLFTRYLSVSLPQSPWF